MSLNPDKTYMVCRAAKLVEKRRIRAKVGGSNPAPSANDERRNSSLTYWYIKNLHPKAG